MKNRTKQHGGKGAGPSARTPLSRPKRIAFTLIALALPFVALLLAEISLRAFTGFGGYPPTFVQVATLDSGDSLISTDPQGSQAFFFRNKDLPGTISAFAFRSPKPSNTVRILLVGGSAIKGYPQTRAFAPSAFLEEMLRDMWPDRDVEVINLGCTAVASFPALTMMTEGLEYQPDLVVVYSGHNEFFGAFGVASLNTVARSPTMIAIQFTLRRFALVQWIDALVAGSGSSGMPPGKLLMEIMMASPYTGPRDPIRDAAARNLGVHIREMAHRCERAGVPVIVCTLPVNEQGLAPLGSSKLDHLNPADEAHVRETLESAEALIDSEPERAIEPLRATIDAAPDHARAHWLLGRALTATGANAEANEHFAMAVDLDPMPWRATEIQDDAIRAAAADAGATLCDTRAVFRDAGESGSVGWDLMDDHVHMALRGQALVAQAIVETLTTVEGPLRVERERFDSMGPWIDYAHRLGDSPFERYAVAYRMRRLFDVPFFKDTNRHALLIMDQRLRDLDSRMSESELRMVRTWQDPQVNRGFKLPISSLMAVLAMQEGRFNDAAHLYLAALNAVPAYTTQSVEFAYLHTRALQRANETLDDADLRIARDALERARTMLRESPTADPTLQRHTGTLLKVFGDHAGSIPHLLAARPGYANAGLVELDGTLVHSLIEIRQFDRALSLADWGIANAGRFAPAYADLRTLIIAAQDRAGGSDPGAAPGLAPQTPK